MRRSTYAVGAVAVMAAALAANQILKKHSAPGPAAGACSADAAANPGGGGCQTFNPASAGQSSSKMPDGSKAPQEKVMSTQASADRGQTISPRDREQLTILNQVLQSKNDNDPRLDQDLRVLAPGARALLRGRYGELAAEKRNERGTIVFLLGRNLEAAQDFDFLSGVMEEAPCRSLKDCQSADAPDSGGETGAEMGLDVTLNYPQIVALKSVERLLSGSPTPEQRTRAIGLIREAMASPVRAVSNMASDLYNRFGGKSS